MVWLVEMHSKKYKKLYSVHSEINVKKWCNPRQYRVFYTIYIYFMKWHANCKYFSKSYTLISFLLKKAYFVPQSRPFSILPNP